MAEDSVTTMERLLSHQRLKAVTTFLGVGFLLHLLWENLQAPLYEGFTSFGQHFWICFRATSGDLLSMLAIYAALTLVHRDPFWVADRTAYAHPATWIMTFLIGILLAVNFELWAVHVDHRWQYASAMPLLPVLRIGVLPVLQMIVVPLLTLSLSFHFSSRV